MTCFLLTNEWQCVPKISVGPPFGIALAGCAPLCGQCVWTSQVQVYDYVYVDTGPQRFQDSTEEEEEFWKTR